MLEKIFYDFDPVLFANYPILRIPTIRQNMSDTGYHYPTLKKVGYRIISFRLSTLA